MNARHGRPSALMQARRWLANRRGRKCPVCGSRQPVIPDGTLRPHMRETSPGVWIQCSDKPGIGLFDG